MIDFLVIFLIFKNFKGFICGATVWVYTRYMASNKNMAEFGYFMTNIVIFRYFLDRFSVRKII